MDKPYLQNSVLSEENRKQRRTDAKFCKEIKTVLKGNALSKSPYIMCSCAELQTEGGTCRTTGTLTGIQYC